MFFSFLLKNVNLHEGNLSDRISLNLCKLKVTCTLATDFIIDMSEYCDSKKRSTKLFDPKLERRTYVVYLLKIIVETSFFLTKSMSLKTHSRPINMATPSAWGISKLIGVKCSWGGRIGCILTVTQEIDNYPLRNVFFFSLFFLQSYQFISSLNC